MLPKCYPPPKWVSVEYKRAVWPFIWKSKSETVSRARCVAPIARGGLNIVDFETKCSSLRLSSLSGYREGFGTCKWHFLARYFFGNRFSNLDPSFDFSSCSIPFSSEPSAFYRNCLFLLSSLRKHGSLPADFSCKNLYNLLLDLPSASPRSSGFCAALLKRPINRWAAVWRKSRLKLIGSLFTAQLKFDTYCKLGDTNLNLISVLCVPKLRQLSIVFSFALASALCGIILPLICLVFLLPLFLLTLLVFSSLSRLVLLRLLSRFTVI